MESGSSGRSFMDAGWWLRQNQTESDISIKSASEASFRPQEITPIRHNLHNHPLFQISELRKLAESFSGSNHIKLSLPRRKESSAFYTLSESEAKTSVHEVFDEIDVPGSWIAIYFAEGNPEYRNLLQEVMVELASQVEPIDPGMYGFNMFIFIAAPPTVTPFHIDRENNLNLQIMGRKRWRLWRPDDKVAVPDEAVEEYFVRDSLRKLRYFPELDARALRFDVGPGEGVHFPATCGHVVTTDDNEAVDAVAVSVAMTYFTRDSRRRASVVVANDFLRRHMPRLAVGDGPVRRRLKFPLGRAIIRARQLLQKKPAPRGA